MRHIEFQTRRAAREITAIMPVQFEVGDAYPVRRTWMHDFYDLLTGYSLYRLLPNSLLPLGPYRPPTHELFHFHNVVALREPPY